MNRLRLKKKRVFVIFSIALVLMGTSACQIPGDSELIEGILQNVDEINGEMTIVTKDGETITIKITKDTPLSDEAGGTDKLEVGSAVILETDKRNVVERRTETLKVADAVTTDVAPNTDTASTDILPALESIEDVFKTLGVWEKAVDLHERGLTWAHVAGELGYGEDRMHIHLREIAADRLERAVKAGLINKEQYERLFNHFDELAIKWTREIFSDIKPTTSTDGSLSTTTAGSDILPSLESIEDVFKTLGAWEKAVDLHEIGLPWAHVAGELDYTEDSMYLHLREIAADRLEAAVREGRISKEEFERQLDHFEELAAKWTREIFSDIKPTTSTDDSLSTTTDTDAAS